MYNPTIDFIRQSTTKSPARTVIGAAKLTQTGKFEMQDLSKPFTLVQSLYKSGHHTPLEFATCTLYLTGVSRAFLAQIRTHRHLSFMSTSQHYQDYSNYPIVCDNDTVRIISEDSFAVYNTLIHSGTPRHEARMCLPNSAGVNLLISGNARAWADMLRLRLCKRNVPEMVKVAQLIRYKLLAWFPTLFKHVHANCEDLYMNGCREMKPCGKNGE